VRASTAATPLYEVPDRATSLMADFTAVTVDEIQKLISSAPNKTCHLDPAPTWLVKDVSCLFSPFVALLCNKSLTTGSFPAEFKQAIIRPRLKKDGLNCSDLKNYRPVFNLPFLSKLLQRVVQARLQVHFDGNSLLSRWQLAYRRFHSIKTAVTKVLNDLLLATRGQMSALCLLDLSAAFDTVDHELLLQRLERQFGLHGRVLQWIRSYLTDRTFCVVYGEGTSFVVQVTCSVPQGSVLGPLFFIVYMADLADLVVK